MPACFVLRIRHFIMLRLPLVTWWGHRRHYQHIPLLVRAATRRDAALDHLHGVFDPYDFAAQSQILNDEMGDVLSHLNLNDDQQEAEDVSADERTIFWTFSKSYPISEVEVRKFFSRFI